MTIPAKRLITDHLTRAGATGKQAKQWAGFLHGLEWPILKPLARLALNSHAHPALAAGMVARTTQDENMRGILTGHLELKAGQHDGDTSNTEATHPT